MSHIQMSSAALWLWPGAITGKRTLAKSVTVDIFTRVFACMSGRPLSLKRRRCVQRAGVVQGLSCVDRLLVVWILGAMVIGVVCGKFAPVLRDRFAVAELYGTPLPIAVGLWLMMWPVLSKVRRTAAGMSRYCFAQRRQAMPTVHLLFHTAWLQAGEWVRQEARQVQAPLRAWHRSLH